MSGIAGMQETGKEEHPRQIRRNLVTHWEYLGMSEDLGRI